MKKQLSFQLHVIAIFAVVMLCSFVPEYNRELFGDWHCDGTTVVRTADGSFSHYTGCKYLGGDHSPTWHWGFRHWMWMLMGLTLFVYNVSALIKRHSIQINI